jgi:serine/threonine-protein kinase
VVDQTDSADARVGLTLDGRYRVEERIARGGMATVYRGFDTRLNRDVAIKVLHDDLAADREYREKFTHEAFSTARLSDPNIVSIFDQGRDGDVIYLVMEYLPGRTLRDLINQHGALAPLEALDVFEQITAGLAAAHAAGIIHRDLKPENVLIAPSGSVKIADFGLARPATASTGSTGALLGTVAYLAPELLARTAADERSDIYSLGVMFYEMLTGMQPYRGEQAMQIAYQHAHSDIPLPSAAAPLVPSGLDDLVVWMTRRDPLDRPADAGELLEQTRWVRDEVGFPPASGRSFLPLLADAEDPSLRATQVLTPTAVAAPEGIHPRGTVSAALPQLATTPDDLLRASLRRRTRRTAVASVLSLLLVAAAGALGWFTGIGPGAPRTVPRVASMAVADAVRALHELGLEATQRTSDSVTVPQGKVIGSDPAAGARVMRGERVKITVSTGPRTVRVPVVRGSALSTAEAALQQVGFEVDGTHDELFDDAVGAGSVVQASDATGTVLTATDQRPQGTRLRLTVSLGAVPKVTGKSLAGAREALGAVGLQVAQTGADYSDTVPEGAIISQSDQQSPMGRGGTVNVVVSRGPQPVAVPDVSGKTVADAMSALKAAGLTPATNVPGALQSVLPATSTNPAAGTQVAKGSTVTISAFLSY